MGRVPTSTGRDPEGAPGAETDALPAGRAWPAHLRALCGRLREPLDDPTRDVVLGQAWKLLNGALSLYLRAHVRDSGPVPEADLEDLAAEKALDLLQRIVRGETDFANRSAAEVVSFISRVARNDLLDFFRKSSRRGASRADRPCESGYGEPQGGQLPSSGERPDVGVERREYVVALRRCAERLETRARLVWFFRVFYDMPSKDIAVHPAVCLKASYVDVLLQRIRQTLRDCMRRRGFEAQDMPSGTFAELWRAFHLDAVRQA